MSPEHGLLRMSINHRLIEIKTKIEQNPPNGRIKAFQFEFLIWWNSPYQPIEILIVSSMSLVHSLTKPSSHKRQRGAATEDDDEEEMKLGVPMDNRVNIFLNGNTQ